MKARRKKIQSPAAVMGAYPVLNREIEVLLQEPRRMILSVPIRERWWTRRIMRWLVPTNRYKRIELDERGMSFYEMCDGEHTVRDIVDYFAERYDLTFHEARIAVANFVEALLKRGIIVLAGKENATPSST